MKKLISICFMLCLAASANAQQPPAEDVLVTYEWKDLIAQHSFPDSEVISMDGMSVLKIEKTNNAPLEITLLTITNTSLIVETHRISVETKYKDVSGRTHMDGFGESAISDELYSRSGGAGGVEGDMQWFGDGGFGLYYLFPPVAPGGDETTNESEIFIEGTSNWRRCYLDGLGRTALLDRTAKRVELSLFLPGPGTLYLRPIKLIGVTQNWWSPEQSALMGGIGGSLIGCLGALIGILAGMGKARHFVVTTTVVLIIGGILLVIAGVVAVALKQPYSVWYPLLLGGAILTFVLSINFYSIKRRYDDQEIRRMTSMDATGR